MYVKNTSDRILLDLLWRQKEEISRNVLRDQDDGHLWSLHSAEDFFVAVFRFLIPPSTHPPTEVAFIRKRRISQPCYIVAFLWRSCCCCYSTSGPNGKLRSIGEYGIKSECACAENALSSSATSERRDPCSLREWIDPLRVPHEAIHFNSRAYCSGSRWGPWLRYEQQNLVL